MELEEIKVFLVCGGTWSVRTTDPEGRQTWKDPDLPDLERECQEFKFYPRANRSGHDLVAVNQEIVTDTIAKGDPEAPRRIIMELDLTRHRIVRDGHWQWPDSPGTIKTAMIRIDHEIYDLMFAIYMIPKPFNFRYMIHVTFNGDSDDVAIYLQGRAIDLINNFIRVFMLQGAPPKVIATGMADYVSYRRLSRESKLHSDTPEMREAIFMGVKNTVMMLEVLMPFKMNPSMWEMMNACIRAATNLKAVDPMPDR